MSIITIQESDNSNALAKRFATLAQSYFANPEKLSRGSNEFERAVTHVPLENLFRILEMFRYDAFSDEARRGVLDFADEDHLSSKPSTLHWERDIKNALDLALKEHFCDYSKDDAIKSLQASLRRLAKGDLTDTTSAKSASEFLKTFEANIP
jgi:hypothetical protein